MTGASRYIEVIRGCVSLTTSCYRTALCVVRQPHGPRGQGVCLESGSPGFDSRFQYGSFLGQVLSDDLKIDTPVATLPAPGITGSALGLVGQVSVYCEWLR